MINVEREKLIKARNAAILVHRKRGWFDLVRFEEEQLNCILKGYPSGFRGIRPDPIPGTSY